MSRLFTMLLALTLFAANLQMMAAAADQCTILTSEDVQTIAGVHVQNVPYMSKPGAGGKCANFAADNGRLCLGVSQLSSAAHYAAEVAAVPQAVYPERTKLTDVWHPWWRARVDGAPAEILKADVIFRAVMVAPGRHVVRFSFHPLGGALAELAGKLSPAR